MIGFPAKSVAVFLLLASAAVTHAQMITGRNMQNFAASFSLDQKSEAPGYDAVLTSMSAPGNVLYPGEQPTLNIQIVNKTDKALSGAASVEIIQYGTRGIPGDIWKPDVFAIAKVANAPVELQIKPRGFADITVSPKIPDDFGGYAIIMDIPGSGRRFVSAFVRTFQAPARTKPYTKLTTDLNDIEVNSRLGVSPNRTGWGYRPTTDPEFEKWYQDNVKRSRLKELKEAGLGITVEFGHGVPWTSPIQPMGVVRPWLNEKNEAFKNAPLDMAWLPQYDPDFKKIVKRLATEYGWPRGPIFAMKLWNEPWEGASIGGWAADMLRYREIFTAMCEGVEEARKEAGVKIMLGGCDSSSNTLDKLFSDGKTDFLNRLDFMSIHYQGLNPFTTYKPFLNRPGGRVLVWDTESWVANVDDRVATVVATNYTSGHDRAVGIYGGNILTTEQRNVYQPDGTRKNQPVRTLWSTAASIGAVQRFIGDRDFGQMLFMNGLPWVMVFDGLADNSGVKNPDTGSVVVVGDLVDAFGVGRPLYRTVKFIEGSKPTITISAKNEPFSLYDFYGNRVETKNGKIVIPLDHRGFYLHTDESKGSFERLLAAIKSARIEGLEPVEIMALDMTAPVELKPTLRLKITNMLNRPISGRLSVSLGKLNISAPDRVKIDGNQTKWIDVKVKGGQAVASNMYDLAVDFDAGSDGRKALREQMRVNYIAQRHIQVDGQLNEWDSVLPQSIIVQGKGSVTLEEQAWHPGKQYDESISSGFSTAYLAYDDQYFYFAARIADSTPDEGMIRVDSPDYDDSAFYPQTATIPAKPTKMETMTVMNWPEGVRRYSYRKNPELPSGNSPAHDNVQIAFNVLSDDEKDRLPNPPGTPRYFTGYQCTDYEFALNPIAEKYGGGTELYRLRKPGMPPHHHYPRQPKSPLDGAVPNGKLVIRREGNTRIVECAIPWNEIPHVKAKIDAGQNIKFSYRVNDNKSSLCMELPVGRSVSKKNNASFQADWVEGWANEIEFGVEKK